MYDDGSCKVYHGDCCEVLPEIGVQADLIITSPPYDQLREYGGHEFDFDRVADACVASLAEGGVLVWVVADSTIDGSESGTSFRHALGFMERGLKLHDTMIYAKNGPSYPSKDKYYQVWEYMFVLVKGGIRTVNLIKDRKNRWPVKWSTSRSRRTRDGTITKHHGRHDIPVEGVRFNIWEYNTGAGYQSESKLSMKHPATFPLDLAIDHILSWSNPGDLVLDPMVGGWHDATSRQDAGQGIGWRGDSRRLPAHYY